jgi:hypothetical protein
MLTLRRGIARAGWVLLALWVCVWVVIVVTGRSQSPSPPPIDAMLALQLVAFVLAWPLAIFLLWRLLLWIGQGFWQEHEATPTVAAPKVFACPLSFGPFGRWRSWARCYSPRMGFSDCRQSWRSVATTLRERSAA